MLADVCILCILFEETNILTSCWRPKYDWRVKDGTKIKFGPLASFRVKLHLNRQKCLHSAKICPYRFWMTPMPSKQDAWLWLDKLATTVFTGQGHFMIFLVEKSSDLVRNF